jgi:cell wall-associated NlpC family hydrolase
MPNSITMPDIHALVDPLLGKAYAEYDCWNLVRHLYREGFGLDLVRDAERAAVAFQELWYRGDDRDPLTCIEPWDLLIIANNPTMPISDHVGIAVDTQQFVHARVAETGVAVARLRTWKSRLLQVARLRELL